MRLRYNLTLLVLLLGIGMRSTSAQTLPDAATLPQIPPPTPTLGEVAFEPMEVPGLVVVQDHQGFMWFTGFNNALTRFDGYDYITYRSDPQDSTTLANYRTESLYVDRDSTLWVGTFGGLDRFNRETETFTHYRHDPTDPTSLSQDTVTVILEDSRGTLWVGTHGGLNRFDRETETFTHYRHDPTDPTSLSNDQVRVLYEDRRGTLWVGTGSPEPRETPVGEGGLNRYDPTTGTFTRYLHHPADSTSLLHNQVMSLYEDSRGVFYVGTLGDGLHTMDREAGTFTRLRYDPNDPTKLSRPFLTGAPGVPEGCVSWACGGVTFIHEDRQGMLWVGGFGGGVNRYDPSTGSLRLRSGQAGQALENGAMTHYEMDNSGLVSNTIWTMAESHDGTLWIGTWGAMHKVVSSVNMFTHFERDPTAENTLGGFGVRALFEDSDGMLWIGTPISLDRFDRATGIFTHYLSGSGDPTDELNFRVRSICGAPPGALWVAGDDALSHFDPATGHFTHYRPDPGNPTSLAPGRNLALLEDSQGRLWIGSGEGLDLLDRATGAPGSGPGQGFIHHLYDPDDPRSLSYNAVSSLLEDSGGTLWVGTKNGLNRYDDETATFTRYLPGSDISSLFEDAAGRFWVGTWNDGLYLFDRETATRTRYGREDGLASNNVAALVEDDNGYLWISMGSQTQGWLSRFDADRKAFVNFDARDGLPLVNFTAGTALKSRDGTLFFGGGGGFIAFNPRAATAAGLRRGPKIVLTGLRVLNDVVVPGAVSWLRQPIQVADEIRLAYDHNDFTVNYTGLSFRHSGDLYYQYMLENYDAGWVDAQAQRSARYAQVAPGSYTFRVRAIDSGGLLSEEDASIRVVIVPPWWRTVWAYLLYGLVFLGGVFAVDRIQRRRLIKQERERAVLEQAELRAEAAELQSRALKAENERKEIELEKARELERAYTQLKTTQAQLLQQEKMASLGQLTAGIAHEIKNPLNFVNNFAEVNEELADDVLTELDAGDLNEARALLADLKRNAGVIAQHGKRADSIVHAMMQHASHSTGEREETQINQLVSEHIDLAYHGKRAQLPNLAVDIRRDLDGAIGNVEIVPQEIGRVLLNLLGNAFDAVHEHARRVNGPYAPTVSVSTRQIEDQVEIRVSDNGPGIPHSVRDKIFEPFFTTKPTGSGTGLGLSLSYDIVTQGHGGTLTVESGEGEGATFIITLPTDTST